MSLLALAVFGLTQALAQTPSSTIIEQHWELLRETKQINSVSSSTDTTIQLNRSALPGGTSKFDPAPTSSLQIVAKVTGAVGAGRWDLRLKSGTSTLATVSFSAADTSYSIKTIGVSWPATDTSLDSIVATKVAPGVGDVAGIIDIRKAYLKLNQAGVVKKTVGWAPMAPRTSVTATSFIDLDDPILFKYVAADYDPAPTMTLRVDACGDGDIRLIDNTERLPEASQFQLSAPPTRRLRSAWWTDVRTVFKLERASVGH